MTGNALLDTVAAITLLNRWPGHDSLLQYSDIYLPFIVVGEIFHGATRSQRVQENLQRVEQLIAQVPILYPDVPTLRIYGEIRTALRRKGRPIPGNDVWIAAVALEHQLPVLTRDAHFREVEGLAVVTW